MKRIIYTLIMLFSVGMLKAQITDEKLPKSFSLKGNSMEISSENIPAPAISKKSSLKDNNRLYFAKIIKTDIDFFEKATKYSVSFGEFYSLKITSENSVSLGFYLEDFHLEENAELYFYGADSLDVLGAITSYNNKSTNDLRTRQIENSEVIIELFVPKGVNQKSFKISKVYYGFSDLNGGIKTLLKLGASTCDNEVDINCDEGADYQDIKHAVIKYTFEEGNDLYLCSGTLINNYKNDGTPFVLTAAHCLCDEKAAKTVTAYFNYEKKVCGGNETVKPQTIEGATLCATATKNEYKTKLETLEVPSMDFTLMKLSEIPPKSYEPFYAGFTNNETDNLDNVFCIHHPQGSYKKISISKSEPYKDSYPNEDDEEVNYDKNCHWHIALWKIGTTETGSSGSGLFNSKKQLIGDLSGGYASCTKPADDYFQMFSKAWECGAEKENQLKYWLVGETNLTELDFYDPYNLSANYRKSDVFGIVNEDTTAVTLTWKTANTSTFESDFEGFENTDSIEHLFLANVDMDNYQTVDVPISYAEKGSPSAWVLLDSQDGDFKAFDGEKCAASFTAVKNSTNDYLTLPKVAVSSSDILSFYAKSVGGNSVLKISKNTKPSNYQVFEEISVPQEWTQYNFSLKELSGNVLYFNFNNITPFGEASALLLDNIKIDKDQSLYDDVELSGYMVYCNSELVEEISDAQIKTFTYQVQNGLSYTFYVKNVYADGGVSSAGKAVTFDFVKKTPVSDLKPETNYISVLYPNPAAEKIYYKDSEKFKNAFVEIFDISGKRLLMVKIPEINPGIANEFLITGLKSGIYLFKISDSDKTEIKKFIVK